MVVLGARPEIIKLAPILFELQKEKDRFQTELIWSGQHRELAKPFLELFKLKPINFFNIMRINQTSTDICEETMNKLSNLFKKSRPDLLMVQSDTTTAFTAALCAYYHQISVAHVEAGLRSGNPHQPFPEEKNRELISHLAQFNFAPTPIAKQNLLQEHINPKSIFVVGNSVVDALHWLLKEYLRSKRTNLISFNPEKEKLLLVTAHRRESFGAPLRHICEALLALVQRHQDLKIVFCVHLNPQVQKTVFKILRNKKQIDLFPPLDYITFIHLMLQAAAILTDSGGIQEEGPSLGIPVFVMRDVTERPEGIVCGTNILVGRKTDKIVQAVEKALYQPAIYRKMARVCHPFGKGDTAKKIVHILQRELG